MHCHEYDNFCVCKLHSGKPKMALYKLAFDLPVPDWHWLSYNKHLNCTLHSFVFYLNQIQTHFNMMTCQCDVNFS